MQRQLIQWCAIWSVASVVVMTLGAQVLTRSYLAEGMTRAEAALRLTTNGLAGHLGRYEALPRLFAQDPDLRQLLSGTGDPAAMNLWLRDTNRMLESDVIYVMDANGTTIAASNFDQPDSFVGQSFHYRPYFLIAAQGVDAHFFGLGTTSGIRGYYFATPVLDMQGNIAGVVAFKIGLDGIEESWRAAEIGIFVTDPEGVVFMSSDPRLLYSATMPMTGARLERTTGSRRYAETPLRDLDQRHTARAGQDVLQMNGAEYLEATQPMSEAGWTVHATLDTAPLLRQARFTLLACVLVLVVMGMIGGLVLQRRALQAEARETLERRVRERTADLARVNARIKTEIAERRMTESELRRTQADLVQAGKLAALGHMSAALSHEINQPLAAARNYADSAAILIDRGDLARARDNVTHILSLIDRIAAIGHHLRDMARRPNRRHDDLPLDETVAEAVRIATPRLAAAGATVTVELPPLPLVRGAAVGLQQVLVNLLTNAADAVEGRADRRIHIGAEAGDPVALYVRDHGPGVPAAIADRIFDPFFSTRQGTGLGLGLSISFNIMKDLGGDLSVANAPDGGAIFTVLLRPALKVAAE